MRGHSPFARFCRDTRAASAAEFALVLPLVLLFLFGIIDVGLFAWKINRDEKATQMGARMAVVTNPVAQGLTTQDYLGTTVGSVTLTQGDTIPAAALGVVRCTSSSCTCATTPCLTSMTKDDAAFNNVLARMQAFDPAIQAGNVVIEYSGSGLGFAGDPAGMQISPLVTVRLQNMSYNPITLLLFGANVSLPSFSYALTMEDGSGTVSN